MTTQTLPAGTTGTTGTPDTFGTSGTSGTDLVAVLDAAGLTGLGGAAFRTATKVRTARELGAPLIVNACDGEIGAAKDAYVVREHLASVVAGARAVAGDRVLYAAHRGSATEALLRDAGLPVLAAPARYVSSEESSLVSLAAGGLARPLHKDVPVPFGASGHAPTVVLNAETLWRVDEILTYGPEWFRSLGTPDEPGPRLVTVTGADGAAVVETWAGEPVADLLRRGGVDPDDVAAVLVGGLSGAWTTPREVLARRWSTPDLAPLGARVGSGVLVAVPHDACPLDTVAAHVRYAGGQSAGQCGPCMFGVPAVADDLLALVRGTADPAARARLDARLPLLAGRGACRFPDGIAGYVASALRVFDDHLRDHAHHACPLSKELA